MPAVPGLRAFFSQQKSQAIAPSYCENAFPGILVFSKTPDSPFKNLGGQFVINHYVEHFRAKSRCVGRPMKWITHTLGKPFELPFEDGHMNHQQLSHGKRVLFFDRIKALMIALVIAGQVVLAFWVSWIGELIADGGSPHPLFEGVLTWLASTSNTFYMCMLFLLTGYFDLRSEHKKPDVTPFKVQAQGERVHAAAPC